MSRILITLATLLVILCRLKATHIKGGTFTGSNIKRGSTTRARRNFIQVKLKEGQARFRTEVELFKLEGLFFDLVVALNKWLEKSRLQLEPKLPVYRWENSANITPVEFNAALNDLLKDNIMYKEGKVSLHNFRAGVTSTMSKLGYSEDMIQQQGRWFSQAYLLTFAA